MNLKLFILLLIPTLLYAENRIKVFSIDTGTDLSHPYIKSHVKTIDSFNYEDFVFHGTHIAGILLKDICPQIEYISCRYIVQKYTMSEDLYIGCLQRAIDENAQIINISSTGTVFWQKEYDLMVKLSNKNVKIIVAAGNWKEDFSQNCVDNYPACYKIKNLVVVGAHDLALSNSGIPGMVWEKGFEIVSTFPNGIYGTMSGTSQATANFTNKLLRNLCEKIR